MFIRPMVLRPLLGLFLALTAALALTLVPSTAFAADIVGGPGDDSIPGTPNDDRLHGDAGDGGFVLGGGDDDIQGDAGNDEVYGDAGNFSVVVAGGDDHIEGDDGDDVLYGDVGNLAGVGAGGDDHIEGGDGDDVLYGDAGEFTGVGVGGDDLLEGGDGNDVLYGDAGAISAVGQGGNDQLFGGAGDDDLFGGAGNDLLCGEDGHGPANPADNLEGGDGTDIACAVDDEVTADKGVQTMMNLATNDEVLNDEADETEPLRYRLVSVPTYISAMLDELTAMLTFTASKSGTIDYEVCRAIVGGLPDADEICSQASVSITVEEEVKPAAKTTAKPVEARPVEAAAVVGVLPNTGASSDPRLLVPLGLVLVVAGGLLVGVPRRRIA